MPVGGRLRHIAGTDAAAGARSVLHHERHAEFRLHVLLQDAAEEIGGAAGRKRNHDGHLPLRPTDLGASRRRSEESGGNASRKDATHASPPMRYTAFKWASRRLKRSSSA